ncbi:hypothetical protein [Azospirillum sp.]|uniref:hypothetical protein n=1 Tax=Azospirillum sp. TaxID=34012 RepID=UPI003D72563A
MTNLKHIASQTSYFAILISGNEGNMPNKKGKDETTTSLMQKLARLEASADILRKAIERHPNTDIASSADEIIAATRDLLENVGVVSNKGRFVIFDPTKMYLVQQHDYVPPGGYETCEKCGAKKLPGDK